MLSQLADLGELIGGIAVVASLVYLAMQIRQNTKMVLGTTLHQNTALWSTAFLTLAQPDIAQAYVAGQSGRSDIRPLHYTQFFFVCRSLFVAMENQYYQMRQGVLDAETYAGYQRSIASQLLALRGFRLWWEQNRHVFSPAFVQHVDGMIADLPERAPDSFYMQWQALAAQAATPDGGGSR